MNRQQNGFFEEDLRSVTMKDRFSSYLGKWPIVLVIMLVCISAGFLYIQLTPSKYLSNSSFIVKEEITKAVSPDLIESSVNGGKKEINLDNEMLEISSSALMERAVANAGLNISYYKQGLFKNADIYKNSPVALIPKQITDSNRDYAISIKYFDAQGGVFSDGLVKNEKSFPFKWNMPFTFNGQQFIFSHSSGAEEMGKGYMALWQPVEKVAGRYSDALVVKPYDTKTSVIQLQVKTENPDKGADLLNDLFDEFNESDMEDRQKLAQITIQFVDSRLSAISQDLQRIEGSLENYRGNNQLIDVSDQSRQSLELSGSVSKTISDLAIQQSVVDMIVNYFNSPSSASEVVPSSLGLNDATLASLIAQYNELQLKKERESPSIAPNSTVIQDMNTQLANLKKSILESLANITRNLQMQKKNFEQQHSQNKDYLSTIPHDERMLQEIKRKQTITENLYTYLLQKREESAIVASSAKVSNYKQVDSASSSTSPEPNPLIIIVYAGLLGFFLSFAWIYLAGLFNDKVGSREELTGRTSLLVRGHINHVPKKEIGILSAIGTTAIGEQFRAIRTFIYSTLRDKNKKIILVTSSANEEGKSFISFNLAAVCAMPGKKIALLDFDIRRPTIAQKLNIDNSRGLTLFLTKEVDNISEICYTIDKIPSLHIYPSGPIPQNPADLLTGENMTYLFEILREEYDYIIIDSPPAGMVSDSFILGEYSDMVLYVVRSQKTSKKQLDFINEAIGNNSLSNVSLIVNDVKKKGHYGFYYQSYYKSNQSAKPIL